MEGKSGPLLPKPSSFPSIQPPDLLSRLPKRSAGNRGHITNAAGALPPAAEITGFPLACFMGEPCILKPSPPSILISYLVEFYSHAVESDQMYGAFCLSYG